MQRKSLTLNKTANKTYTLVSATQDEIDEIEKLYQEGVKEHDKYPFLSYLKAYGDVKSITNESLKPFIPLRHVHTRRDHNAHGKAFITEEKEYCCYGFKTINFHNNLMIHEDRVSSFKCACETLMSNTFLILESKEEIEIQSEYPDIEKTTVPCSYQRDTIEGQEIANQNPKEDVSDNSGNSSVREEDKSE